MTIMNRLLILLSGVLWLAACHTSQPVVYTQDRIVPVEKSLVWKISGNGLKTPSYLYGTIHLIPKDEYEMPETIREALDHCKRVTFEIDMKELTSLRTQFSLMTKAFMPGKQTLKDLLPAEDYAYVKQKMAEKGLAAGMMERMKPMFLSTMMSGDEESGSSGAMTSVEMELYKSARRRKLETAGLETTAYQMGIFDSIPYRDQAKMLVDGLRSMEVDTASGGQSELEKMLQMYRDQDITSMQAMIAEEEGMGQYENLLLGKRNRNWIAPMSRMMEEKSTIFAVGAGHLGGPGGVVALLRQRGYSVEPAENK